MKRKTIQENPPPEDNSEDNREDNLPQDKKGLRAYAKAHRASLSRQDYQVKSQQLRDGIQNWRLYQQAEHILLYSPTPSELNIMPLAQDKNKYFYLSRTWKKHKDLTVHRLNDACVLEHHPYGYQQPSKGSPHIMPSIIDMVLVPGLLFDRQGGRLGYGGGYYDRLLHRMPRATFVATVLADLCLERFPAGVIEPHDVAMQYIITEREIMHCMY